jgi:Dolichyl-phosphate-mannose-protein mannosyltransferase
MTVMPGVAAGSPDANVDRRTSGGLRAALAAHVGIRVLGFAVLVVFGIAHGISAHDRLVRWDGGWYRDIARNGYGFTRVVPDGRSLSDYAFFPLYPALERLVSEITGLHLRDAGLLISAVCSVAAAWGIYAVARHVADERTGVVLVVLWSALPIGIVQSMAYTESLFTALAAWALYSILRDRYVVAGLLASLAGLTRPIGGAVVLAVLVAAALRLRRNQGPDRVQPLRVVIGCLVAPLGLLAYLGWVGWRQGSLLGYFEVADGWGNGVDGGASFAGWIGDLLTGSFPPLGLLVCAGLVVLGWLLVVLVRRRYPVSLVVFSVAIVVIALTTSGYFGSKPRYLLPAFPLLLPLAEILARSRPAVRTTALAAYVVVGAVYGAIWLYGPGPP